jgi:hypothetical protein
VLDDEKRNNIGLDVINMIENVLAKGNNLHFKTSDPYVAQFAQQYVNFLKAQGLKINASIDGPKTQQSVDTTLSESAKTDFEHIKTKHQYDTNFKDREWVQDYNVNAQKLNTNPFRPR